MSGTDTITQCVVLSYTKDFKFSDLLESLGLEQHVTQPTHIHDHTLDLAMTRKIEDIFASPPRAYRYFSDHAAVRCDVFISKPSFQTRIIKFRKTKSVVAESLWNDVFLQGHVIEAIAIPSPHWTWMYL